MRIFNLGTAKNGVDRSVSEQRQRSKGCTKCSASGCERCANCDHCIENSSSALKPGIKTPIESGTDSTETWAGSPGLMLPSPKSAWEWGKEETASGSYLGSNSRLHKSFGGDNVIGAFGVGTTSQTCTGSKKNVGCNGVGCQKCAVSNPNTEIVTGERKLGTKNSIESGTDSTEKWAGSPCLMLPSPKSAWEWGKEETASGSYLGSKSRFYKSCADEGVNVAFEAGNISQTCRDDENISTSSCSEVVSPEAKERIRRYQSFITLSCGKSNTAAKGKYVMGIAAIDSSKDIQRQKKKERKQRGKRTGSMWNVRISIYIYVCVCVCVCVYIYNNVLTCSLPG